MFLIGSEQLWTTTKNNAVSVHSASPSLAQASNDADYPENGIALFQVMFS